MSTVSGKKSAPSRTEREAVAVASTTVSPIRPTTAPSASWASLPASKDRVRSVPLIGPDTEMASAMCLLFGLEAPDAGYQSSITSAGPRRKNHEVIGDWQPMSLGACLPYIRPPG